jgi:hypothetical protein
VGSRPTVNLIGAVHIGTARLVLEVVEVMVEPDLIEIVKVYQPGEFIDSVGVERFMATRLRLFGKDFMAQIVIV